ncbi:MAG: hypothetical protein ACO3CQ_08640 [Candidatus Nanopelagicaceae bacterium]
MQTFRVIGRKMSDYAATVQAADADQAYDIAADLETHKWSQLETDDVIEPIEVELIDIQLNKDIEDEWPSMETGIVIEGK